jgi:hypothetical protein
MRGEWCVQRVQRDPSGRRWNGPSKDAARRREVGSALQGESDGFGTCTKSQLRRLLVHSAVGPEPRTSERTWRGKGVGSEWSQLGGFPELWCVVYGPGTWVAEPTRRGRRSLSVSRSACGLLRDIVARAKRQLSTRKKSSCG